MRTIYINRCIISIVFSEFGYSQELFLIQSNPLYINEAAHIMKVCFLGPFVVLWQHSCVILVNNYRIYKASFFIINYSPVWFLFTRNITTAPFLLKGSVYPW